MSWLRKLPSEIVYSRPRLSVFAWTYLLTGKFDKIDNYLTTAEKNLPSLNTDLNGQIAAIRAYATGQLGYADQAIKHAKLAFDLLPKDDFTVRCVVAFVLGGIYYIQQDMPKALATLKEASQLGERAGNLHVAVGALSALGGALEQQGNLAESEKPSIKLYK